MALCSPARLAPVALGLRHDGKKEIIDFRLAASESAAEWEKFLADLYRRGLTGEDLDMICVDGGAGLLAALPGIFPNIAIQRCWAHKIRNVLDKVRKADQPKVKRALHKIINAANAPAARSAARHFAERFREPYPAAVACLRNDLDELLTCFRYKAHADRRAVRTTPSSVAFAKSDGAPDRWEPSRTKQAWTASCSPSSPTKISHRVSVPLSR